ncbi:transcriptional regulator [Natronorarus salvus]|uniref:transcriptional regulator n=1 Tax=Natronorarus salvus TaxID=3117733 RepID=UPI002F26768A
MVDEALDALLDIHRRRVLMALLEHNPQHDEEIHIPEEVHVGEKEFEILQTEMFHTHLPKLEESGFIRWDEENHEVVRGPRFDEIKPLLELMADHADELPDDWV